MTRNEAKRGAKALQDAGYYGIELRESYPEGTLSLRFVTMTGYERAAETVQEIDDELS